MWNTNDSWTLKGGVSRGYKTPTLNQLHSGINGVSGQGRTITIGSPDLDPEITTNYEIGAYYDNLAGFNSNVTVFHNKFKDKIDGGNPLPNCYSTANPNQPGCVSYGSNFTQANFAQSVNIGKAITQGVELAASWQFLPDWSISGNYTYTDSEQRSGADKGAQLTNTPEHMAYARLQWETTERLSMWFKGEYRGDRKRFTNRYENLTDANKAVQNQVGDLKAYEVFHLGGAYRASDTVTLTATIYNVFDKDFLKGGYYTYLDTNGGPVTDWASEYIQSAQGVTGTLEEGRRLWLSATVDF